MMIENPNDFAAAEPRLVVVHNEPKTVLTDLHVNASSPEKSIAYPGPRRVTETELAYVRLMLQKLEEINREDFLIEFDGSFWRGRLEKRAVDGTWFKCRKIPPKAPNLDRLPSPMPAQIKSILLAPELSRGGLIVVAGGAGCGKTTTGSATLVSRLMKFGGVASTIEDPPEYPLNGWHGEGWCSQTWVAGESKADWAESMRGVLRSQPTGSNLMLYVGEVRDKETALAMLRAASNGFLVITTSFGTDIITGIDSFFQLIGRENAASLAAVLRVILYQKIDDLKRFHVEVLISPRPSSPVGTTIRNGQLTRLVDETMYQRNLLVRNGLSFDSEM